MKEELKDKIKKAIETGEVKMRPRWHFVVKGIAFACLVIAVGLAALYVTSFIIFALHRNGLWFVPVFGFSAVRVFITSLPWLLILLALGFLLLLEMLLRKYAFGFRKPLLISAVVILLVAFTLGLVVDATSFHEQFSDSVYERFGAQRFESIYPCLVVGTADQGIYCEAPDGETFDASITPLTRLPLGNDFKKGDKVVIFGLKKGESIRAMGIRKADRIKLPPPRL